MAELETAKKSRAGLKGWLTVRSETLIRLLKSPTPSVIGLTDAMEQFDMQLARLEVAQGDVQILMADEAAMLQDISAEAQFIEKAREPRIAAAERLRALSVQSIAASVHGSAGGESATQDVTKLPKLTLAKFSGEFLEWEGWWDIFHATVHDTDITPVAKFSYLKTTLEGNAADSIRGLAITSKNYETAIKILTERYGKKERIIFSHVNQLINVSVPGKCNLASLRTLCDTLMGHTRALENLGVDGTQYGVILTPLVLSKLPPEVRLEWARGSEEKESDLEHLLDFLKKEITRRERSQALKEAAVPVQTGTHVEAKRTASALQTLSNNKHSVCAICMRDNHPASRCWRLTRASKSKRHDILQQAGVCYVCLSSEHQARSCSSSCHSCKGKHHVLICDRTRKQPPPPASQLPPGTDSPQPNANLGHALTSASKPPVTRVLLQSARVTVRGTKGVAKATVVFDTGSDRTYVRSNLVNKVGFEKCKTEPVSFAAFGSSKPSEALSRNIFHCILQDVNQSDHSLLATEVNTICAPLFRPAIPSAVLESLGQVEFGQEYESPEELDVDILVGLDAYWRFVDPRSGKDVSPGLIAQSTPFGVILSGSISQPTSSAGSVSHQLLCLEVSDETVKSFWSLESVGILPEESESVDPVFSSFQEKLRKVDDRYETELIWKPGAKARLLDNEKIARIRQSQTSRKLEHDPLVQGMFNDALFEMEATGVIEEVPADEVSEGPVYYMPSRPVVRESAVSTKCRPVFDASCKGFNGVSLNDCMEVGPCLLGDLTAILVRFRRWRIAITADIQKAFLQIRVRPEDCNVHRFLWDWEGQVRVMRFTRVPFGNCQSPFLLNGVLKCHLETYPETETIAKLKEDIYMDDLLSGCDFVPQCCDMMEESSQVMAAASMKFAKIGSSSAEVGLFLRREFQDRCLDSDAIKVLGMVWRADLDCFIFEGPTFPQGLRVSKRVVISFYSKLFDPLGLAAPFVMQAKCLFQELWLLGLTWDEPVPPEFQTRFGRWVDDLSILRSWRIPRCYTPVGWSGVGELTLHAFGDASPNGYGACVYLVCKLADGTCTSSLVLAKAKVAPIKARPTLPRLELLASLLCARLIQFVINALRLPVDVEYRCWTDSMIALSWIQSDPGRWKAFVANRVVEIQRLTSPERWAHCKGSENVADLLTRGISAEELVSSQTWLQGPDFIHQEQVESEIVFVPDTTEESLADLVPQASLVVSSQMRVGVFDVERWGTLTKAIRVVAWVRRFIHNARQHQRSGGVSSSDQRGGDLSFDELQQAKIALIRDAQQAAFPAEIQALEQGRLIPVGKAATSPLQKLSPFLGETGLLQVRHRLQYSTSLSYEEKHPIILPRGHLAVLFTRFHHVLMKHAGVETMLTSLRNEFWAIGARGIAKRVKKFCVPCQRQDLKACSEPMPPLPGSRVNPAHPFEVSGLDHAGPLYCSDFPGKKFWILLITCAVTRAVHIELVEALSTRETLLALRRLVARRGLPKILYSDNAKGFKKCPEVLAEYFGHLAPSWQFIAPLSPWRGGWWERLIGSCKSALRKSVGRSSLSRIELETVMQEVEACMNSRPLTFVSDEVDGAEPLTPAHFLLGHRGGFFGGRSAAADPSTPEMPVDEKLLSCRFERRKALVDQFFKVWTSQYIRNLPPSSGGRSQGAVKLGSLVLLEDDRSPRLHWPLGIVEQVFPSAADGVIRTVEVRTKSGKYVRSLPRVHALEMVDDGRVGNTLSDAHKIVKTVKSVTAVPTGASEPIRGDGEAPRAEPYKTRYGRTVRPIQ